MTNAKGTHTPGPWVYRQTADTFQTGRPVFGVGPKRNGAVWFVAEQIYEEDARLIAAAPDLLAALEGMLKGPASGLPAAEYDAIRNAQYAAARAAIAKARGEAR